MRLVALVESPPDLDAAVQLVAAAAGLAKAEARMRLAPAQPIPFARVADADAAVLVARLRKDGLAAVWCPFPAPSDASRLLARTVDFGPEELVLTPRAGASWALRYDDVALLLRGTRSSRVETSRVEKQRSHPAFGAVDVAKTGLPPLQTQLRRSSEEELEHAVLLYDRAGRCAAVYERELSAACLGPLMQPSSAQNVATVAALLRSRAKAARYDERLMTLGRRALPFGTAGEEVQRTQGGEQVRTSTAGSFDVVAALLWEALGAGL